MRTPYPVNSNSSFSSFSRPWRSPFFLPLWIRLLEEPHISGIRQYLFFCDWLISLSIISSKFIHITALYIHIKKCVRTYFFLKVRWYSIVCTYHILFIGSFIDRNLDCFWLLWVIHLWTWVSKYLFECLFSVSLVLQIGMKLLDHMVIFGLPR